MATSVYEVVEVELIDGTKLSLRPLKITLLREFMKKFQGLESVEVASDNDKSMDLLIDCIQIAMKQYNPDLAADKKKLEDVIDLPTVYKIIEIASGVKLNDPNLLAAAAALSGQN
jgi:Holliday junction resolvase